LVKVCKDPWEVAAPHMSGVVDCMAEYFAGLLFGKHTADTERSNPTYYASINAASANDVPFGVLINVSHPMGELPPKTPQFRDVSGDFTLQRLRAYIRRNGS
jgi:hypothetical protein